MPLINWVTSLSPAALGMLVLTAVGIAVLIWVTPDIDASLNGQDDHFIH